MSTQKIGAFFKWLLSPIVWIWRELIGLRSEQVRSISVVTGIVMLFRGFDRMRNSDSLYDPHVVVTLICLVMIFGLAWQATSIKGKVAGLQVELGGKPDALVGDTAQDLTK